jgi:uroporphyrinogen decarboxylase
MKVMNAYRRVLTSLRREGKPDRLPFEISWGAFAPSLMEVYRQKTGGTVAPDEYFDFDTRSVGLNPTCKSVDFHRFFAELPPSRATFDEWGCGSVPGSVEHFVEFTFHPLESSRAADDIRSFSWPDVTADYRYEGLAERVEEYHRRGYAVTGELYQTIFERAWLMRGLEQLLMDFLTQPEIGHAICQCITDLRIEQARRLAALDIDVLRLGDDICTQKGLMMSLGTYRTFLKERTRMSIRAAKEVKPQLLVFMHCDGRVEDMVEDYIDIGVDILNPIQPECNNLVEITRRSGRRLSFWGGIGTQSTMPFGTPGDVAAAVDQVRNVLGREGGLLVAPTHILEPEVPWDNVLAFIHAARNASYD